MTTRPAPRRPCASTAALLLPMLLPVLLTTAMLVGCSGADDTAQTPATASAASSSGTPAAGTSTTPGASAGPGASTSGAPSVKVGQSATLKQDVSVRVLGVKKVQLTAQGVGEIAGAGAAVELRVRNASARPIALGELVVNAYYGADRTPAVPNTTDGSGGQELAGNLKAGRSRTGTYLFTVPSTSFSTLDVEVSSGDSPYAITFVQD